MTDFLAAGFSEEDLIPVSMDLVAANKSPININGAVFLRLQGLSTDGTPSLYATCDGLHQ